MHVAIETRNPMGLSTQKLSSKIESELNLVTDLQRP
jgi:hypothetical protein